MNFHVKKKKKGKIIYVIKIRFVIRSGRLAMQKLAKKINQNLYQMLCFQLLVIS